MYISEIAPTPLRGRFVGSFEIFYQIGGLCGFWINYGVSLGIGNDDNTQWRIPVSIQLPLAGLFLTGVLFLPESPRFLMMKDRFEEATTILCRVRNLSPTHPYLAQELTDIHNELQFERQLQGTGAQVSEWTRTKLLLKEACTRQMLRRISVGVITQFIGQLSGTYSLSLPFNLSN